MNEEEFVWLVARLETQSAQAPRAFRGKVILISCAAYVALLLVLLANILVLYASVSYWQAHGIGRVAVSLGMLGLITLPVSYAMLRALLTPLDHPDGRFITRAEAPVLFALLDKMRVKLKGPPIHRVLITEDYNAAIARRPRWGLIGPATNYLMLGLPFMIGHSTSEMMATLAHEYGHLCGGHGKLGSWVYRQRMTLGAIHERLESTEDVSIWHAGLMRALDAFMPYFNAYTFVLSRQNEYEADRTSAKLAGADAAASNLTRVSLLREWFHTDFWDTLYRQANLRETPAFMPYQSMDTAFRLSHADWATRARLTAAWAEKSGASDTHPCLRERVEALGHQPALPAPVTRNAATTLLGALGAKLIGEFDRRWWANQGAQWGKRHRHFTRSQARLRELRAVPFESMPLHEVQELALLTAEFESRAAAKPVLQHLLRQPGGPFPRAAYIYGSILLDEDDQKGLDYLATAARQDQRLADDALRSGYFYLCHTSGQERAEHWCKQVMRARAAA